MTDSSTPDRPPIIVIDEEGDIVPVPRFPSLFSHALRHSDEGDADIWPFERVAPPTFSAAEPRSGRRDAGA